MMEGTSTAQPSSRDRIVAAFSSISALPYKGKLEIEARLGLYKDKFNETNLQYLGRVFTPGVQEEHFHFLLDKLRGDSSLSCTETKEVYRIYPHPEGNLRMIYDAEESECMDADIKCKIQDLTLEMPNLPYDIRISVSSEIAVDPTTVQLPTDTLPERRVKTRWSFENNAMLWKIELTRVISQDQTIYEVEFELTEDTVQICKMGETANITQLATKFFLVMVNYMSKLPSKESKHTEFANLSMIKVENVEEVTQLRAMCVQCIPGVQPNDQHFPGSMPINFSRRHIPLVQSRDYYVSEKTDGIRYLMFITDSKGVFLVDRKFDFYRLPAYQSFPYIFATSGVTLLDGEMVIHQDSKKPIYLVFDLITLNGENFADKNLSVRLQAIGKGVIQTYRTAVTENKIPSTLPFVLLGKQFFPKTHIGAVFSRVREFEGERCYIDDKRFHKTDGIIFTPDEHYTPKTCNTLFKWKYMDTWSIDLKVNIVPQRTQQLKLPFQFTCLGAEGHDIPYDINMRREELLRLVQDMSSLRSTQNIIVECAYDQWNGGWLYKLIRTDKSKANFVKIIFETLEVISENIPKEELLYRIPVSTNQDDWRVQLKSHLKRALESKSRTNG